MQSNTNSHGQTSISLSVVSVYKELIYCWAVWR